MNIQFLIAAGTLLVLVGGLLYWALRQEAADRKKPEKPQHQH